jgi:hypothetical protein
MATGYEEAIAAAEAAEISERRRMRYIAGALAVLLVGCVGLGIYASLDSDHDQTFNFIALLIIFMTALAASSIIFVGLKMGSTEEAFGLPSGSVRALLAIGIMILFVVFGLPVVTSQPKEVSSEMATLPADQLAAVTKLNTEQGFLVRVHEAGGAARPARIEIVRMDTASTAQMDLNKQMLTAIITLLTTVIGFYFGSRSATDAMKTGATTTTATAAQPDRGKDGKAAPPAPSPAPPTPQPAPAPPPEPTPPPPGG